MKRRRRDDGSTIDSQVSGEPMDPLDDELATAVERSYAKRLATGTNLSEQEEKRIAEKKRQSAELIKKTENPSSSS